MCVCVCFLVMRGYGIKTATRFHSMRSQTTQKKSFRGVWGGEEILFVFECLLYMLAKAPENPFTCKLEWCGRKSAVGTSTIALRMRLLSVNCINLFSFSALEAGLNGDWKILVFVPVDASKLKHKSS